MPTPDQSILEHIAAHPGAGRKQIRKGICNIHALLADGLLIDPAMSGRLREIDSVAFWPIDPQRRNHCGNERRSKWEIEILR